MNSLQQIMLDICPEVLVDTGACAPTKNDIIQAIRGQKREELYIPELEAVPTDTFEDGSAIQAIDFDVCYSSEELPGFTFNSKEDLEQQTSDNLENPLYHVDGIDVEALHFVLSMKKADNVQEELAKRDKPAVEVKKKPFFKTVNTTVNNRDGYTINHKSNGEETYDEIVDHNPMYDNQPSTYRKHQEAIMKAKISLKQCRADEAKLTDLANQARAIKDYGQVRQYEKEKARIATYRRRLSGNLDKYNKLDSPLAKRTKRVEKYLEVFTDWQQRMLAKGDPDNLLEKYTWEECAIKKCGPRPKVA